jgi:hypothetical protein
VVFESEIDQYKLFLPLSLNQWLLENNYNRFRIQVNIMIVKNHSKSSFRALVLKFKQSCLDFRPQNGLKLFFRPFLIKYNFFCHSIALDGEDSTEAFEFLTMIHQ